MLILILYIWGTGTGTVRVHQYSYLRKYRYRYSRSVPVYFSVSTYALVPFYLPPVSPLEKFYQYFSQG